MPFPYADDHYFAPRTSGVIVSTGDIPVGAIEMPPPSATGMNSAKVITEIATIEPYYGNTTCVRANQINYSQMAGSD